MKKPIILVIGLAVLGMLCVGVITVIILVVIPNFNKANNNVSDTTSPTLTVTNTAQPSDNNSTNTGTSKACDILTQEIAETVLNVKVTKSDTTSDNTCTYSTADKTSGDISIITIVISTSSAATAMTQFEAAKTSVYGSDTTNINGLNADAAYWANQIYQLSILKNDKWIIISAISSQNSDSQALSVSAAKLVLAKI